MTAATWPGHGSLPGEDDLVGEVGREQLLVGSRHRRFYALVLLATFASLRWGEATALRRSDVDLEARTRHAAPTR